MCLGAGPVSGPDYSYRADLFVGPEGAADLLQSIGSKDFRRDPVQYEDYLVIKGLYNNCIRVIYGNGITGPS